MADAFFNMGIHGTAMKVFWVMTMFLAVLGFCWPLQVVVHDKEFPWLKGWNARSGLFLVAVAGSWFVSAWLLVLLDVVVSLAR